MTIDDILAAASVVPVIEIDDAARAGDLAKALAAGGLHVAELTMRTTAALASLEAMKAAAPDLIVGMGTIIAPDQAARAVSAGADFLVTPGTTSALFATLREHGVPALPGVATASEVVAAVEAGFERLKFFPAEAIGGAAAVKSFAGPFPTVRFCPTGGISAEKARDYLGLSNVACVGGSWVAPRGAIAAGAWETIEENARRAASLAGRAEGRLRCG
ncbi:MAG: bifunctional 4-hydroxy-2-oxoglutarate aldolase/2-dehydro-3-deoxy-phosphogluconate aldolase [Pseudomonadota bacterium]